MRTHVIPAQITTVEDRIAGNLNWTQLFLLMIPVLSITTEFITVPPKFHLSIIKVVLAFFVTIFCCVLALRIKGRVVFTWVSILLRYNLRPRWYVLNKNDGYLREMYLPVIEKRKVSLFNRSKRTPKANTKMHNFSFRQFAQVEQLFANPNYTLSIKTGKKGDLNVRVEQVK